MSNMAAEAAGVSMYGADTDRKVTSSKVERFWPLANTTRNSHSKNIGSGSSTTYFTGWINFSKSFARNSKKRNSLRIKLLLIFIATL